MQARLEQALGRGRLLDLMWMGINKKYISPLREAVSTKIVIRSFFHECVFFLDQSCCIVTKRFAVSH